MSREASRRNSRTKSSTAWSSTSIVNTRALIQSVRRSVERALTTGKETDLYEALSPAFHLPIMVENGQSPQRAYYVCPQGRVERQTIVKRRDRDALHDGDFTPSDSAKNDLHPPGRLRRSTRTQVDAGNQVHSKRDDDEGDDIVAAEIDDEFAVSDEEGIPHQLAGPPGSNYRRLDPPAESISMAATSSSVEELHETHRLTDFLISMALLNDTGAEEKRFILAVCEAKLTTAIETERLEYRWHVSRVMNKTLPQVIHQVQLAFAQAPHQDQIMAIQIVNYHCRFLWFDREVVPVPDPASLQERGYYPAGMDSRTDHEVVAEALLKFSRKATGAVQIISNVGNVLKLQSGYGLAFKEHWDKMIQWSRDGCTVADEV